MKYTIKFDSSEFIHNKYIVRKLSYIHNNSDLFRLSFMQYSSHIIPTAYEILMFIFIHRNVPES